MTTMPTYTVTADVAPTLLRTRLSSGRMILNHNDVQAAPTQSQVKATAAGR
jgi:hypothetical protein